MLGVSFSPGLKWIVLVLLPLTLAWKLFVYPDDSPGGNEITQAKIAEFLVRQHFTVTTGVASTPGEPTVRATSPLCRILVAESPSEGWGRDITRLYSTPEDTVFIVYRGKVYYEQPTWLTVSDFLWAKFPRAFGLNVQPSRVLTVIATRSCEAERLPWSALREQ